PWRLRGRTLKAIQLARPWPETRRMLLRCSTRMGRQELISWDRRRLKSDCSPIPRRRCHEIANCVDDGLDVCIVAFEANLKFGKLGCDLAICGQGLAHPHKSPDYEDAHLDGPVRTQSRSG